MKRSFSIICALGCLAVTPLARATGVSLTSNAGVTIIASANVSGPDGSGTVFISQGSNSQGSSVVNPGGATFPQPTPSSPLAVLSMNFYKSDGTACSSRKTLQPPEFASDGETGAVLSVTLAETDGSCIGDVNLQWTTSGPPAQIASRSLTAMAGTPTTIVLSEGETSRNYYVSVSGTVIGAQVNNTNCGYYYSYCLYRNRGFSMTLQASS